MYEFEKTNRRNVIRRTSTPGLEPTIPISGETFNELWINTDIMDGEMFLNTFDKRLWIRTGYEITEIISGEIIEADNFVQTQGFNIERDVDGNIIKVVYDNGREEEIIRVDGIVTKIEDDKYEWVINRDVDDTITGVTFNIK